MDMVKPKMKIEKLDYEGKGIAKENNKIIFIPRTLPREEISAILQKQTAKYAIYRADNIITKSNKRVDSFCSFAKKCGGCTYDIVSYDDSLKYKKELLTELMQKNKIRIDNIDVVKSANQTGYRNKITLKIQNNNIGYYQEESHEFIKIDNCKLADPTIQKFLQDYKLLNLREKELTIRTNYNNELLLIIKSKNKPTINKELIVKHKIAGIIWNDTCIYNEPFFFEKRDNILYKVRYSSFFQINNDISNKLKNNILKYFTSEDNVLDLYCGVGFFSLPLAKKVNSVKGIEYNKLAIVDAIYNSSLNNINNASFHAGKVEEILAKIPNNYNKVIVDPPRKGLAKEVVELLNKNAYQLVCYISCNPFTLIRDLKALEDNYKIKSVTIYDMFAYTKHYETLTILEKKD